MQEILTKVEGFTDELILAVQESVKIRSLEAPPLESMPYGAEVAEDLKHALETTHQLGFKTVNLDGHIGYAEYGEGEEYVAVLGHLDVVPEGNGWSYPPFGGEIHDGKIFGRGTTDDKGPIFAALFGLKAIKELKLPLTKRVRIILGLNEETGCTDAKYYMSKEKPPVAGFTTDAEFPVIHAEKGIFTFSLAKKLVNKSKSVDLLALKWCERENIVSDYCEAVLATQDQAELMQKCVDFAQKNNFKLETDLVEGNIIIKSYGVSAHASTPELGVNAIMQLVAFLAECELDEDAGEFIRFIERNIGREINGQSLGIALKDEPLGTLTVNPGIIRLENNEIKLTCNVRFPVTYKFEAIIDLLRQKLNNSGVNLLYTEHAAPLYFPKEHPLIKTLSRVFAEQTGLKIEPQPLAIGGGTYAKCIPNIVAYGPEFPGTASHVHEADEFIAIKDLIISAKIYALAVYELAR